MFTEEPQGPSTPSSALFTITITTLLTLGNQGPVLQSHLRHIARAGSIRDYTPGVTVTHSGCQHTVQSTQKTRIIRTVSTREAKTKRSSKLPGHTAKRQQRESEAEPWKGDLGTPQGRSDMRAQEDTFRVGGMRAEESSRGGGKGREAR